MDNNNMNNGYYESPVNNQYVNQQMYNQQMGNPMMSTGTNAPDYMLWLVLGIVQIVLICCCNLLACIAGVLTVIFVIAANNSYKMGNMIDYQSKMKTGRIINIVGWVLMIANLVIAFFAGVFELITGIFS